MNHLLSPAVISLFLLTFGLPVAQALPLQNGNFASFAGWQGYLYDGASSTAVDPATDSSHFSLLGGGQAQLADDSTYFEVALEQTFDLPANALEIIFDFGWDLTSVACPPGIDFPQAVLIDNGGNMLDLLDGVDRPGCAGGQPTNAGTATTAIDSLAGQTVTLQFLLQGGDDLQDTFRIGNIHITPSAPPIPVPATLLLFSSGLLGLVFRQWQFSRRG